MLKNIPAILTPDFLKILMEMGHGDELVIADGNFPSANYAQRLIRLDGHRVPPILDAVMKFFPLDTFVDKPTVLMQVVDPNTPQPPIWEEFHKILQMRDDNFTEFEFIERFQFYERSKKAYAIIATGETALYANIIVKKGVVT